MRFNLQFASIFVIAALFMTSGCERVPENDSSTDAVDAVVESDEKSEEQKTPTREAAPKSRRDEATSRALGDATSRFAEIFSNEDGEETSEDAKIDVSLVDEETKRKYTDDRTLVTPTLAARDASADDGVKYRLAYRFEPNSNLSWNVVHLVRKRISYGGQERLIETSSTTYRRWEFLEARDDGKVGARHWIDRMILRQNEEGKEPVDYDSERDVVVPKEISTFGTEKAVGVALETFDINPFGVMSDKTKLVPEYQGREGDSNVMVPFPKEEVMVGDVWTIPYALYIKGGDKVTRPYRVVERFRLESIDDKYATISFKTTLVSIVDDPVVEGELAERLFSGNALFDRELGLTTRTELTFNKTVPGAFGFSSFLEYNCKVVEKLIRDNNKNKDDESTGDPDASSSEPTEKGKVDFEENIEVSGTQETEE